MGTTTTWTRLLGLALPACWLAASGCPGSGEPATVGYSSNMGVRSAEQQTTSMVDAAKKAVAPLYDRLEEFKKQPETKG